MTLDTSLRVLEIAAIVFWFGVSWNKLTWMEAELKHLRELCEDNFMIKRQETK